MNISKAKSRNKDSGSKNRGVSFEIEKEAVGATKVCSDRLFYFTAVRSEFNFKRALSAVCFSKITEMSACAFVHTGIRQDKYRIFRINIEFFGRVHFGLNKNFAKRISNSCGGDLVGRKNGQREKTIGKKSMNAVSSDK